jgi:hypothetical protein
MHRFFPAPLLLVATIIALSALALLLRGDGRVPLRRLGEAFIVALGVITVLWLGWILLWLIDQWW